MRFADAKIASEKIAAALPEVECTFFVEAELFFRPMP
jgi:hypothetical protein